MFRLKECNIYHGSLQQVKLKTTTDEATIAKQGSLTSKITARFEMTRCWSSSHLEVFFVIFGCVYKSNINMALIKLAGLNYFLCLYHWIGAVWASWHTIYRDNH